MEVFFGYDSGFEKNLNKDNCDFVGKDTFGAKDHVSVFVD